jgi:hypothetical protein
MMNIKKCFRCGASKPLSEFYRHPKMADGRLGKCKDCTRADVNNNRQEKNDYYAAFDRARANLPHRVAARKAYAKTDRGRMVTKAAKKRWIAMHPAIRAAHVITGNAIRDKRLIKGPCEVCGTTIRVQAHHDDYTKPMDVRWLCVKHHNEHHKAQRSNYLETT